MQILDHDPLTGITTTMQYNAADDSITVNTQQDCTSILDFNAKQVIEADHSQQIKNDWIRYAKVPYVVIDKWRREYNVDFFTTDPTEWRKVMALINSSDFCKIKTTPIYHDR